MGAVCDVYDALTSSRPYKKAFPAEEALAIGLIDRIVEAEALMQTARGLASDVLAAKPGHAAAIKRMVG